MKNFKSTVRSFLFPMLFAAAVGVVGCERPELAAPQAEFPELQPGKFRRVIEVKDGESKVTLAISSDNEASLTAYEASLDFRAVSTPGIDEQTPMTDVGPETQPTAEEECDAVHISVLKRDLAPGMTGFVLSADAPATGKATEYGVYSTLRYFYSWEAPHYFKVTPLGGRCVSAWLYQAGSTWTFCSWAGGSGGNYLCSYWWAASSNVNSLDYRLKAQGAYYSVYWY